MNQNELTVGILGGMGPEATVDLMQRVIAATPANDDADHIRMLVDNDPKVPSRIKALIEGTGESPGPYMAKMAQGLERGGADFLVIPCNTAHKFYPDVESAVSVPVLNLLELAAAKIHQSYPEIERVGLLASTAVQLTNLYATAMDKQGIKPIFPDDDFQQNVMTLIKAVKAKNQTENMIAQFNEAAENLEDQGAGCLLIACTELSVIADSLKSHLPIFDAAQILADEIVLRVKG
ncbi:putative amino-acid racemase [Grimontia celer]|uniref:Putative amino-acid racemase n=1 Tax=Grimontia celer TaxID=1796497 RepID=A0A128F4U3_9GAMM|nr:amino acid racemase [Grimontia celer]CZF81779.1 putative amino-acid racemase [Grimontia celer]